VDDNAGVTDKGSIWLLNLLEEACNGISLYNVNVGFILFHSDGSSNSLNILRLSGSGVGKGLGSGSGVMEMDSLPGTDASSFNSFSHLIQTGIYTSPSRIVAKHFAAVRASILSVAWSSRPRHAGPSQLSASSLLSACAALAFPPGGSSSASSLSCHVLLLLNGPLQLGAPWPDPSSEPGESPFLSLGRAALSRGLFLDGLLLAAASADSLALLVRASGGLALALPQRLDDPAAAEACRLSLLKALGPASLDGGAVGLFCRPATLEVRCQQGLRVRRMQGPIHSHKALQALPG